MVLSLGVIIIIAVVLILGVGIALHFSHRND